MAIQKLKDYLYINSTDGNNCFARCILCLAKYTNKRPENRPGLACNKIRSVWFSSRDVGAMYLLGQPATSLS